MLLSNGGASRSGSGVSLSPFDARLTLWLLLRREVDGEVDGEREGGAGGALGDGVRDGFGVVVGSFVILGVALSLLWRSVVDEMKEGRRSVGRWLMGVGREIHLLKTFETEKGIFLFFDFILCSLPADM
jgi:hypothetical protein